MIMTTSGNTVQQCLSPKATKTVGTTYFFSLLTSVFHTARFRHHVVAALLIRFLMVAYGEHMDSAAGSGLAYTDVDYHVFTDAARHVCHGQSPYQRATYRYSPIFAWLLSVGCYGSSGLEWRLFGKLVFCLCDVLVGGLIWRLTSVLGGGALSPVSAASLWWYNPLSIGVASRGNAESLVLAPVLGSLICVISARPANAARLRTLITGGILLGTAIHLKLYPVILAPAFFWSLADHNPLAYRADSASDFLTVLWRRWAYPNYMRVWLAVSVCTTFLTLTAVSYGLYGEDFAQHALLYHLSRRDARHNFSIFFYVFYLTHDLAAGGWLSLVTFLPQLVTIAAIAIKFCRRDQLAFCAFCQVYAFVTFNKVCTSQYFLWYLSLLPAAALSVQISKCETATLLVIWYLAQASWLLPAYLLEFQGLSVFRLVWAESVAFFCANVGILARLIRKCRRWQPEDSAHQHAE